MTVQDIFALRKQGKVEEAYEAIRPIYKEHKGRFTTLCMFWTACDVFKLRLEQKRVDEAVKIYEALRRLLPRIEEIEASDDQAASKREESPAKEQAHHKGQARGFMKFAEGRLIKESERFRKRYFAIRDRKKRNQAVENEGLNIPSDSPLEDPIIPSELSDVIPCVHPVIPSVPIVMSSGVETSQGSLHKVEMTKSALSKGQQAILDCIKAHPGLKVPGIETETGIPAKSIERHIKVLIERNLIEHRGSKKTGGYHAL